MIHNIKVLMSTYNGELFLDEQIQSIISQKRIDVTLKIRDDGSNDKTKDIVKKYASHINKIALIEGENVGAANSFFELIKVVGECEFYAFSDQDDVWDSDKLKVAVSKLENVDGPAMYCSATRTIDENGNIIKKIDDRNHKVLSIEELLLSNNAVGCTIVINQKLMKLLKLYIPNKIIMHDHWVYLVCVSCGGSVVYDKVPHISYRQHSNNVLGDKIKMSKKIKLSSFSKSKNVRSMIASELIEGYSKYLDTDSRVIIDKASNYLDKISSRLSLAFYYFKNCKSFKRKVITAFEIIVGVF